MSEWWTYRLGDFLLFAPRTYYRLFELYNERVWPLQILAAVIGLAILAMLLSRPRYAAQVVALLLALCWAWVAYAVLFSRYATINLAATYFAIGFAVQAGLLLLTAAAGRLSCAGPETATRTAGIFIFAFALLGQPGIGPLLGRDAAWHRAPARARLVGDRALRACARPDRACHARRAPRHRPDSLGAPRHPASVVRRQRPDALGDGGAGRSSHACRRIARPRSRPG